MPGERTRKHAKYFPLIVEMYEERGMTVEDISKIINVPSTSIHTVLQEKGIEMRPSGRRPKGKR